MRRPLLIGLMAVLGILVGLAGYHVLQPRSLQPTPPSAIGGPFQLVDVNGRAFTDRNLRGRPTLMYFGFTYCPEICPTSLAHITQWLQALGPDADRLNVVFVTVDPQRDTPAQLRLYLSNFDRRIIGLTGSEAAVAATAQAFRIYYRRVPLQGGAYTMDHSTAVYLLDRQGRFVAPIRYGAASEEAVSAVRRQLR